jgi:hypothetical protein
VVVWVPGTPTAHSSSVSAPSATRARVR